jgi:hypothetical protein
MSCKCNGISMCEGRRNFALMPAVIQCDNRHAIDPRPLAREQIAAIPGVRFPYVKVAATAEKKTERTNTTKAERDIMLAIFQQTGDVMLVAKHTGRHPTGIRAILSKAGVYSPKYKRRMKKKEAA